MVKNIEQNGFKNSINIHQYYMDIINCMPNVVYWINQEGLFSGCNLNFFKLLEMTPQNEFIGTPYDLMAKQTSWTAGQIESVKRNDRAVLISGIPEYNTNEFSLTNKAGEALYYLVTRVPLYDADKTVTGLVVILNDITAQKNMEKLLNHTHLTHQTHGIKYKGKSIRVLLVEDNIIAQHVQQSLLMSLNCDVDIAGSGDAACMLFEPGKYGIVFMDIGLQDTSGYIVSKTFREMEKNTRYHVPIIALTVYQAEVVKDDCSDYFMDGVITKPLTSEKALQIIKQHVYQEEFEAEEVMV